MTTKIDPELLKQLEQPEALSNNDEDDDLIEAVIKVEPIEKQQKEDIDSLLKVLLMRIEESEHLRPVDYNTFPLMKRAVVRGKKSFIKKLIEQNEVVSAMANRQKKNL